MTDRLPIDDAIDAALRAQRELRPLGFTPKAMASIRAARTRARVLTFSQVILATAACWLLVLPLLPSGRTAEAEQLLQLAGEYELSLPALDDAEALAAFVVYER